MGNKLGLSQWRVEVWQDPQSIFSVPEGRGALHVRFLLEGLGSVVLSGSLETFSLIYFYISLDSFKCMTELRNIMGKG